MGVNVHKVQNSTHRNNNLYNTFKQQLVTDGTIQWRQHNDYQDTVIMSDYNPATGSLKPLSYVHVTCTTSDNDTKWLLKCTCQIYNTIQCAGLSDVDLLHGEKCCTG